MQKNSVVDRFAPLARGFAQAGIRIVNERTVLTLIGLNPGSSNADLARLSGLGPQTTSRIVAELEARDLVLRGEVLRGRRGQPATPLFINPDGAYVIGVEIGWRHFEVLLLAMSGQTLASVRRSYAWPDIHTIFADISAEVATIRAGMTEQQASWLVGIGVASPSHIDRHLARLGAPDEQVGLWRDLDVAHRIGRETDLPAEWFNDGSAGCWCEYIATSAPRPHGLAYFQVSTLVGAGIAIDGNLWEGRTGNAANLGAILVSGPDGRPAYVHDVASILALQRRLGAHGMEMPVGSPLNWDWDALEPVATAWLDDAGLALAKATINARAVMEIDITVIGGVIPQPLVQRLLDRVKAHLAELPATGEGRPVVAIGQLGGSAAATGAAQLVLFNRFFSRAMDLFAT